MRTVIWNQSAFFPTVGDEGDILIGLDGLLLEMVENAPLRLAIIAIDETDVARSTLFRQRAAYDQLEILLPVVWSRMKVRCGCRTRLRWPPIFPALPEHDNVATISPPKRPQSQSATNPIQFCAAQLPSPTVRGTPARRVPN